MRITIQRRKGGQADVQYCTVLYRWYSCVPWKNNNDGVRVVLNFINERNYFWLDNIMQLKSWWMRQGILLDWPCFLALIRKSCYLAVNHLPYSLVPSVNLTCYMIFFWNSTRKTTKETTQTARATKLIEKSCIMERSAIYLRFALWYCRKLFWTRKYCTNDEVM